MKRPIAHIGFIILLIWSIPFLSNAQCVGQNCSKLKRFELDEVKGCAPFTVEVTRLFTCSSGSCSWTFEKTYDPSLAPNEGQFNDTPTGGSQFTYNTPGVYILAAFIDGLADPIDEITVTVLEDIQPSFDIFQCTGNEVTVVIDDNNYDQYEINFNEGGGDPGTITTVNAGDPAEVYDYVVSGTFDISVRGVNLSSKDNCTPNIQQVTTLNSTLLPLGRITRLESLNSSEVSINYSVDPNISYSLEVATNGNTIFQHLQDIDFNSSSLSISGLDLENNYYCFRIVSHNRCDASGDPKAYSDHICSIKMDVTAADSENRLIWDTNDIGVNQYDVTKDGIQISNGNSFFSYNDGDVVCNTRYCYRIFSHYSNGSTSLSAEKCVLATSTAIPPSIQDISTVVSGKSITLTWQDPTLLGSNTYSISRKLNQASFSNIGNSTVETYVDKSLNPSKYSYCYQVPYNDLCSNPSSNSIVACSILLTGLENNNSISLAWNSYTGWQNGVKEYILEEIDLNDTPVTTTTLGLVNNFNISNIDPTQQVFLYRIIAIPNDEDLPPTVSNIFNIEKENKLFFPSAFTPGSDGLNDEFKILGRFINEYQIKVFNRWGEMVFFSSDQGQGWDGSYQGKLQPQGTYGYTVRITDFRGRVKVKSGTVLLLQK